MRHADQAREIVEDVAALRPDTPGLLAMAQVHALLAIAEAIEGWQAPGEPEPPSIPFDLTKEGQQWP